MVRPIGMRPILLLPLVLVFSVQTADETRLPEFTGTGKAAWINAEPQTVAGLRGKVVLLEVWAFGCGNCARSAAWVNAVQRKFAGRPFAVIGIHTPEFEHEKNRGLLEQNMRRLGVRHAVMVDNDQAYWQLLNNRYWPTFYLVDQAGAIQGVFVGETHTGDAQARAMEKQIAELISR